MNALSPLVLAWLVATAPAQDEYVLVLEIESVGLSAEVGRGLTSQLVSTLAARPHTQATDTSSCQMDEGCIERLTEDAGVGYTISGSVGEVGGQVLLNLSLIDTSRALPLGRVAATASTAVGLDSRLPGLVDELFGTGVATSTSSFALRPNPRFVILDFTSAGVDESVAKNLTQVVATQAQRLDSASVLSRDDISAMLGTEQLKSVLRGECDRSCFAEIAGAMDADYLIVGQVGRLGATYVASMTLLDQHNFDSTERHRITETYRGDEAELLRAVQHASRRLLGLPHGTGGLSIGANESDVRVFVDAELIGTLPFAPRSEVRGGRHIVRLEKDGYFDWQRDIYVGRDEVTAVWAELQPKPQQWYEKWWVWAIAGTVVVGATAAVVATRPDGSSGTIGLTIE